MRSDSMKFGADRGLCRSLMMTGGLDSEMVRRPLIGVVNSYTNLFTLDTRHLTRLVSMSRKAFSWRAAPRP